MRQDLTHTLKEFLMTVVVRPSNCDMCLDHTSAKHFRTRWKPMPRHSIASLKTQTRCFQAEILFLGIFSIFEIITHFYNN